MTRKVVVREGRPPSKVSEVKSALQMSGVYGRVIDRERITLPDITMWRKYKQEKEYWAKRKAKEEQP